MWNYKLNILKKKDNILRLYSQNNEIKNELWDRVKMKIYSQNTIVEYQSS